MNSGFVSEYVVSYYRFVIGNRQSTAFDTSSESSLICLVLNPKSLPYNNLRDIITSSRDAFPARSPIPFTVVEIPLAPASTPDMEFITARPKSL